MREGTMGRMSGDNKIEIKYDTESPLETKIAEMRFFNKTTKQYHEDKFRHEVDHKRYDSIKDVECVYKGEFYSPKDVTNKEILDKLQAMGADIGLDYLFDKCFCCEEPLQEPIPYYRAWGLDSNMYCRTSEMRKEGEELTEDDKKWDKLYDEEEVKFKAKIEKLKEEGSFLGLEHGRIKELLEIGFMNECRKCGNLPTFLHPVKQIIVEPTYDVKKVRASNGRSMMGLISYNEEKDEIKNRFCCDELEEGYRHVSCFDETELLTKLGSRAFMDLIDSGEKDKLEHSEKIVAFEGTTKALMAFVLTELRDSEMSDLCVKYLERK